MIQRTIASALTAFVLFCLSLGFANAQVASQKANVNHSDGMLLEQAQSALKKSNYVEARTLLESLINTHPDSDYVPLAKLSIADSWYSQHAFKRAEVEYRDFITFFPVGSGNSEPLFPEPTIKTVRRRTQVPDACIQGVEEPAIRFVVWLGAGLQKVKNCIVATRKASQ